MTTHHMKNHANKPCPSQNHSQTKAPITRQMIVIGKMNIVKGYFNPFIHFKFPNWPKSTKFQNLNSKLSPEKKVLFFNTISYIFFPSVPDFKCILFPLFFFLLLLNILLNIHILNIYSQNSAVNTFFFKKHFNTFKYAILYCMIVECVNVWSLSLTAWQILKQDEHIKKCEKKIIKEHLHTAIFRGSIVPALYIIFDFEPLILVFLDSKELGKISAFYKTQLLIPKQAYFSIFYTS